MEFYGMTNFNFIRCHKRIINVLYLFDAFIFTSNFKRISFKGEISLVNIT